MVKRHIKQTEKQKLGQYFTTNANLILEGYEHVVFQKNVIDPFAGGEDLLKWGISNGATSTVGYDICPSAKHIQKRDSLVNPPDYKGHVLVTNPPYLSSNKCRNGDKTPYKIWKENDYYKCHLASLDSMNCDEALIILPSNFFCESRDSIRKRLFNTHYIVSAKYWNQPTFDDATTGTCVIHVRRGSLPYQQFKIRLLPQDKTVEVILRKEHNYLYGEEFFKYIDVAPVKVLKTDVGMSPPNTKIIVGLLDNGKFPVGLSINTSHDIYCQPKSFTTYQVTLPDYNLTLEQQHQIVQLFQQKLSYYRNIYHDMFLANYMGPKQKIISRRYINLLLSAVIKELKINDIKRKQYSDFFIFD